MQLKSSCVLPFQGVVFSLFLKSVATYGSVSLQLEFHSYLLGDNKESAFSLDSNTVLFMDHHAGSSHISLLG